MTPEDRILHGITTLKNDFMDAPTAQLDAQIQAITALRDASASWSPPNEIPSPTPTIPLHDPAQTCRAIKVQKRMLKHTNIKYPRPPYPTPRVPNEPAPCDTAPRVQIKHNLLAPLPRVHPKETSPDQPIVRRTRFHMRNSQQPVDLAIM